MALYNACAYAWRGCGVWGSLGPEMAWRYICTRMRAQVGMGSASMASTLALVMAPDTV